MLVRLLGPVELVGTGGSVAVGGPKERALLAFLALHVNETVSEAALVDALWAEDPPRTAVRTLQAYLSRLRRALQELVEGDSTLETRPGGWVLRAPFDTVDVRQVEALSTAATEAMAAGDHLEAALSLAHALELWNGEPLAEFADLSWASGERARLGELRSMLIETRLEAELACGRAAKLLGELDARCRAEPLRERLWALRMLALYRAGRQADALRAFQELRTVLRDEIGIDPSPALVQLEQRILAQDPDLDDGPLPARGQPETPPLPTHPAEPHAMPAGLCRLRATSFVGRDAELAALAEAWDRTQAGSVEIVLLSGEPGIGKTSLAVEQAALAITEGAVVLFGRCDEESLVPFQPFVEAIGDHIAVAQPDALRRQLGDLARDLALLVPALGRVLPEVADVGPTGAENERYRLFEAVPSALAAIGGQAPVLLVLDDLHWADRPTLQLLQHLIRRRGAHPLLVVGTYRDTDLVRTHPMAETLAELRRANLVDRIPVRGLTLPEVTQLVSGGVDPDPADDRFATALWRETEGSPLFLREILRHLAETGVAVRDDAGRWRATRHIGELGIPEGIREVIGRRLTRLSEATNIALRAGSVLGREVRIDVLEHIIDLDADAILDALEEATVAGVLDEVPGAPGHYAFTHALLRQALYAELSLTRRVRLHEQVGEALEHLHGKATLDVLAHLAHHFSQAAVAGTADKAIDYGERAAAQATDMLAFEDAARLLATALEVAEDAGAGVDKRADLLLAIGAAHWSSGRAELARAAFERVITLVGDRDADRVARAALGIAGGEVRAVWVEMGLVNEDTIAVLEHALELLPQGDSEMRAGLLAALARDLYYGSSTATRRGDLAAEAVAMSRRLGDPAVLANALCAAALALYAPETATARHAASTEAGILADELGDPLLAGTAGVHQFLALVDLGRWDEARVSLERGEALLTEHRDPMAAYLMPAFRGGTAALEGRFGDAEQAANEAFQAGHAVQDVNSLVVYGGLMMAARVFERRAAEVLMPIDQLAEVYPAMGQAAEAIRAGLYAEIGLFDEARAAADRVDATDSDALRRDAFWLYATYMLARACWRLGDVTRAERLAEVIRPHAEAFAGIGTVGFGPMHLAVAWCDTVVGRYDDAAHHFEAAAAMCERNRWHVPLCETYLHHAVMHVSRGHPGDRQRAAALLARAAKLAVEHGLDAIGHEIDGVDLDTPPSRVPVPTREPSRRDLARALLTGGARAAVARLTRDDSDEELVRRFGSPLAQRALFRGMTAAFQPTMAFGFEGDVCIELRGRPEDLDVASDWWTVQIRDGKATARPGGARDAALTLHATIPDFVRLVSGELSVAAAINARTLDIEGDVILAARLPQLFGAVRPMAVVEEP